MRLTTIIFTTLLLCAAQKAMSIELPANIQQYLQSASLTEDGELSGNESEQTAFINYVKTNWSGMLDSIETIAPQPHQQMLIVAGAEYLPGRDYLAFFNKLCDRKVAGKVVQLTFERAVTAITPKKTGFLAWNHQDAQTRQLVQRVQGMLPQSNKLQPLLSEILSGVAVEAAETATKGQGLPEPEKLAPPP